MSSGFFLVLLESHLNMDSSAIFASPFLSLVFKGFEFLEPSDLMSPWQTVRKSTARSLQSSISQSCLRAILTPHWHYSTGVPTYLTYSFLVPHHHPTLSRDIQHRLSNGNQTPFCLKFLQGQLHFKGVLQKPKVFTYMTPADSVSANLSTPAPTIPQPCLMHLPLAPQVGRTFSVSRLAVVCGFHLECLSLEPLHGMLLTKAQQVSAPRKPPGALPAPKPNRPPHPHRHFSMFICLSLHLFPHLELSN